MTVSDDGCGMNQKILDKIYEPFFTTKNVGKGTGFGLAMVYGIIKQNEGCTDVNSELDQGTLFTIHLPRHTAMDSAEQKKKSQQQEQGNSETILLVEDEQAILKMTKSMLERQNYIVMAASTPGEAIRMAQESPGPIHLLMTDVIMPEMNGRDLAKNILPL